MNNPNPFVPQGILIDQKNRSRARLRLAVFSILGVPVLGLLVLLITQGCRREQQTPPPEPQPQGMETNLPPVDTNLPAATLPTNPPAAVTPTPTPTPAGGATEYTVVKGDTFSTIGKKFNVSSKAIQDANPNVDPRKLQLGQKLAIPAPAPAATAGSATSPAAPAPATANGEQIYTVKSGDTLTSIGKRFGGVSPLAIEKANNLTSTRITVGQKLKIPVKAAAATAPVDTAPATTTPVPILSNVPAPVR